MSNIYFAGARLGAVVFAVCLSACANFSTVMPVPARIADHPASMAAGLPSAPPVGLVGFCLKYLSECMQPTGQPVAVALDNAHLHQLEQIQAAVNAGIAPRDVPGHAWDYPVNGTGECNEYALEKRKELIDLGWPREALLLTAAYTERGEGHLVLVARTSGGDLVLDNRTAAVVDWSYLPYQWVSQESPSSLVQWVSLTVPAMPRSNIASAPSSQLLMPPNGMLF